jgi:hypothetical protein
MMKYGYFLYGIFFLLFLAVSCTERIEIDTSDAPPHLVIYGYINTDTTQHSIRITRSAGYFSTQAPEGISHAEVIISTDDEVILLSENDTIAGLYQTSFAFFGRETKRYTLDVRLDFNNDRILEHYQASAYLADINTIDSIVLQRSPIFTRLVEVLLYAQDRDENNYYSIFVSVNDSVLNSTINNFIVMDDVFFNGTYMNGIPGCYINPKNSDDELILKIGDKVTMNINAISEEYADYISQVQSEVRGSNPIFGGPPANVKGNIRCVDSPGTADVSGFFTAYASRYASVSVKEDYSEP